jgi:flagellar hook assembly protein FlgD
MDGSLYGFWNGTAVSAPVKVDSTPSTEVNRSSIATPGRWTFTAYPNPASGNSVTFSMHGVSEEMILKIYSSNGRLVKVIGNNGNYTSFRTELKDNYGRILPSGNYLAVLYNGNGKQIKSFDMKIIR